MRLLVEPRERLIDGGFVREVRAKSAEPVWRRDDQGEGAYTLKLTAAGKKAASEFDAAAGDASREPEPSIESKSELSAPTRHSPNGTLSQTDAGVPPSSPEVRTPVEVFRPGSKIAKVIAMLRGDTGATISELISTTGWLPHTTRAALTGLRKRGYAIERSREDAVTRYKVVNASTSAPSAKEEGPHSLHAEERDPPQVEGKSGPAKGRKKRDPAAAESPSALNWPQG